MTNRRAGYHAYDPASQMHGPFLLGARTIAEVVPEGAEGVYLLTSVASDGSEIVTYVGRGKLRQRLHYHRSNGEAEGYVGFYFVVCSSKLFSFKKECREFHRHGGRTHLDNEIHPRRPAGYSGPACSSHGCPLRRKRSGR